jgi:hypothetical protein
MARDTLYQVKDSFITSHKGAEVAYTKGELVPGDDPGYKRAPHLFEALTVRGQAPVEQATAAPGEKRNVVRRAVRKVTKPRQATPAEEKAIVATVEAEAAPEPEPPVGHAITTSSFKGGG